MQPAPIQLLDLSTIEEEKTDSNSKSAAQVFLEEKVEKIKARQQMGAKLALLKREVKVGRQLLQQTKTLLKSREALVKRKVRVSYNKCHKFWRGQVISAHKPDVAEQVDAAKGRLGLRKSSIKFNISVMVEKIDKLAPGARYKSANPLPPSSTSTSRPRFRTFVPRSSPPRRSISLAIRAPPVLFSASAKKSSLMLPHTPASAWCRGDKSIVAYGDAIAEDLCYDHASQLQHRDDGHEDQLEVNSDSICTDCALGNSKEHEVGSDYICEDCDFSDATEPQSTAWYRGDPCIVSHGDTYADDLLCYDHAIQLETSAELLWDGNHDFTPYEEEVEADAGLICEGCGLDAATELEVEPCFAVEEVEDCGVDLDTESYHSLWFDVNEFEVECSDAATDPSYCDAAVEEYGDYYYY